MKISKNQISGMMKKGVEHHFFTNDFYFAITYIVLAAAFLLLSIASIVAVEHSKYIILGGLIPLTVLILVPLVCLLIANIADYKKDVYKSWQFWLILWIILVHLVGLPVIWSFLVPDYLTFAEHYKNWNPVTNKDSLVSEALVDSALMNKIRISLWFDMIFVFMTFVLAIVVMIFVWKDKYDNKNIITNDKLVQEFIEKNNNEVEFETQNSDNPSLTDNSTNDSNA